MNKGNCALKLVDEVILYYDERSKKHQIQLFIHLQIGTKVKVSSNLYCVLIRKDGFEYSTGPCNLPVLYSSECSHLMPVTPHHTQ